MSSVGEEQARRAAGGAGGKPVPRGGGAECEPSETDFGLAAEHGRDARDAGGACDGGRAADAGRMPVRRIGGHELDMREVARAHERVGVGDEFARGAEMWDEVSRRSFLGHAVTGVAVATGIVAGIGGVGGCSNRPDGEKIVPPVVGREGEVAGRAVGYATAVVIGGYARGVVAVCREGRVVKLEGNPDHPDSLGGTDALTQAALWDLYDAGRMQSPGGGAGPASFGEVWGALAGIPAADGVAIVTGVVTSPTVRRLAEALRAVRPEVRWYGSDVLGWGGDREVVDFAQADVIVSVGVDFLGDGPGAVRNARGFAGGRRARGPRWGMSRVYVAESALTLTGAAADERIGVRPSEYARVLRELAAAMAGEEVGDSWVRNAARDLRAAGRKGVLLGAGGSGPGEDGLVRRVAGQGVAGAGSLKELVEELRAGTVRHVVVLGGDPVGREGKALGLGEMLRGAGDRGGVTVYLGERECATSGVCAWRVPEAHVLESWGDGCSEEGVGTVIQPVISPALFGGVTAVDVVNRLLGKGDRGTWETVRETWLPVVGEAGWVEGLRRGVMGKDGSGRSKADGEEKHGIRRTASETKMETGGVTETSAGAPGGGGIEVVFRPDPAALDGTYAGNAWMQECPRPFTKQVWGSGVTMSAGTAGRLGVEEGEVVEVRVGEKRCEGPAVVVPGTAEHTVVVTLGGSVDAYAIWSAERPVWTTAVVEKTGRREALVFTRGHQAMVDESHAVVTSWMSEAERELRNRKIVRVVTAGEMRKDGEAARKLGGKSVRLSLYEDWGRNQGPQWGMSVDLSTCIGCNACVVACQAENNIPVVGAEGVARGREMHWIRIDSYFHEGRVHHQAVMCQHCERAPCEYVCPVAATTHSTEGLNQMTYNRCVGTRYCSNNCPYKVRRFNFFNYTKGYSELEALRGNPEVSVRTRGVMEKCTMCVQRIQNARAGIPRGEANGAGGETAYWERLETACQGACPTQAIVFGAVRGLAGETKVMREKREPHDYSLLEELGTRPRVSYLARVINPAPVEGAS